MDIRAPILAVLVGGTPAPGINSVINAVTLEAINDGCRVIGIKEGFKYIREGITDNCVHRFERSDVANIYAEGGCLLRTSRDSLVTPTHVDNVLRVLEHLRVRYLVTIGGTVTARAVSLVADAAVKRAFKLSIVHVPKTIFNDLPLPENAHTFGFDTAKEMGARIVHSLKTDARAMPRWYVVVMIGQLAGHLSLGIGKAASATITLIPEEFKALGRTVAFSELCDIMEACVIKRLAMDRDYGIAILAEGLVDLMSAEEVEKRFGSRDKGHQDLGRHVCMEVSSRLDKRGIKVTMVSRNVGNELRSAAPNATDIELARDLGYGATRFLLEGGSGCMVTLKDGGIQAIPLKDIQDEKGETKLRLVNCKGLAYEVARKYMCRLTVADLDRPAFLLKLAKCGNMSANEFVKRYRPLLEADSLEPKSTMKEDVDELVVEPEAVDDSDL